MSLGTEHIDVPAQDLERAAEYEARRPGHNYSEFKPEFADQHGRQYEFARGGSFLENLEDEVHNLKHSAGNGFLKAGVENQRMLLWIRMPIRQKYSEKIPEPDGEQLVLYHVETQTICTAKTTGVFFHNARARTGYVFVDGYTVRGRAEDPQTFDRFVDHLEKDSSL